MRRHFLYSALVVVLFFFTSVIIPSGYASAAEETLLPKSETQTTLQPSILFIENDYPFDEGLNYQTIGANEAIWFAKDAIWITIIEDSQVLSKDSNNQPENIYPLEEAQSIRGVNLRLSFIGANSFVELEPFNKQETLVNYFIGSSPDKWRIDMTTWGGMRYKNLYPGIDLEVFGEGENLVMRVVAKEGVDLGQLQLQVDGQQQLSLEDGQLIIQTSVGEYLLPLIRVDNNLLNQFESPVVDENRVALPFYSPEGEFPDTISQISPPTKFYSSYLGGNNADYGQDIAATPNGEMILIGVTFSSNFPTTPGAWDRDFNTGSCGAICKDLYIAKLSASGSSLEFATFLGGNLDETGGSIAIDSSGNVYITGITYSPDFPVTAGAFDSVFGGGTCGSTFCPDLFVAKLTADGSNLVYSTYLGGSSYDYGIGIGIDGSGAVTVIGDTSSSDITTTPGSIDTNYGGLWDGYIAKLNSDGTNLIYAAYLGGISGDYARSIAVDPSGIAYVSGNTGSEDFPTTPYAFDPSCIDCSDAFVIKLSADGSNLIYGTFFGGSETESGHGIAIDPSGAVYLTGETYSVDLPTTPGAYDTTYNGVWDTYVAKLTPDGSGCTYATYIGGNNKDFGYDIAVDKMGSAWVTGVTKSADFPTTLYGFDLSYGGGICNSSPCFDAFFIKLNPEGSALDYASFIGGSSDDESFNISTNANSAFLTGTTSSSDFPISPEAYDDSFTSYSDAFVVRIPVPFLDLPLSYTDFLEAARSSNGGGGPGYINSWFDNDMQSNGYLTRWDGISLPGTLNDCILGVSCYDHHNGVDFRKIEENQQIFAAAGGTIINTSANPLVTHCEKGDVDCGNYFGNQVWIDHGNGYATLYAHLEQVYVSADNIITDPLSQPLGTMGSTGKSTGYHLHFGLYYDMNHDEIWSNNEAIDPFGDLDNDAHWFYSSTNQYRMDSNGGYSATPSGIGSVTIPPNALSSPITVSLGDTPPTSSFIEPMRSTGYFFDFQVLEWVTMEENSSELDNGFINDFNLPVTVTVQYDTIWFPHLDIDQLTVHQWDEDNQVWVALPTILDTVNNVATAQTTRAGYIDLKAPLLCTTDDLEPNDNFDQSSIIPIDGTPVDSIFDIDQDEDWFRFEAIGGKRYFIQTSNLSLGVDTFLQIFDTDGVTVLASHDNSGSNNSSQITWQAPRDGQYFIQVSQVDNSAYGCSEIYQLKIALLNGIYLPVIVR